MRRLRENVHMNISGSACGVEGGIWAISKLINPFLHTNTKFEALQNIVIIVILDAKKSFETGEMKDAAYLRMWW